jgi:hypothetical protein
VVPGVDEKLGIECEVGHHYFVSRQANVAVFNGQIKPRVN